MAGSKKNRWVSKVKTDSTHPPAGLFTKKAPAIARALASKRVSPKGPSSGMRMLTYFINRAGRGLSQVAAPNWKKRNYCCQEGFIRDMGLANERLRNGSAPRI